LANGVDGDTVWLGIRSHNGPRTRLANVVVQRTLDRGQHTSARRADTSGGARHTTCFVGNREPKAARSVSNAPGLSSGRARRGRDGVGRNARGRGPDACWACAGSLGGLGDAGITALRARLLIHCHGASRAIGTSASHRRSRACSGVCCAIAGSGAGRSRAIPEKSTVGCELVRVTAKITLAKSNRSASNKQSLNHHLK